MLDLPPTKLLYLEDFSLLESETRIQEILEESGKQIIILDRTVFYPQGGGQPYDAGVIESPSAKFIVEEVRFLEGAVRHIGHFEKGEFHKGETVTLRVDKERRALHSRIHSAGHVVDMAVYALKLPWIPGKGYHFPDGPYVEYAGSFEGLDKGKLKADIEEMCSKFIQEGRETKLLFMNKEQMKSVCHFVPDYIPPDKPGRVVMYGDFGVPCGGTHVSKLSEIGSMIIRNVKADHGNIRVAYDVAS